MLVKLKVPLLRQKKGTVDCGIVSLQMILKYYDDNVSFEDLKKAISVDKVGTYAPQLGSYLLNRGYSVRIVTFHPSLFTLRHRNMSQGSVKAHLKRLFSSEKDSQKKKVLGYFLEFLKSGGEILADIPNPSYVKKELMAKRPVGQCLIKSKNIISFNFMGSY